MTSILSESWASAKEMGTGDDLIIAAVISSEGRARLLRVVVAVAEPAGFEKSLQSFNERINGKSFEKRRTSRRFQLHQKDVRVSIADAFLLGSASLTAPYSS